MALDRMRASPALVDVAFALVATRVATIFIAFIANLLFTPYGVRAFAMPFERQKFAEIFAAWDSGWYFDIASRGYYFNADGQSSIAFFPLYPMLMRAAAWPFGGTDKAIWVAGIVVSSAAFALALLEDQYFGSIPERVLAFMADAEAELYKCGVPIKTRHNEVAPSQYEVAPIFESANVATDHQMMTMETLKRVAPKYGLACLLHEKPFAGVNGSGKHLNWSIGDDLGNNLLNPGDTPHDNMQFLFFCTAVIRAVDVWQGLLRMSIAHAGNDHRLGANEAPPAILSVFLGDMLTEIFEQVEGAGARSTKTGGFLDIGVAALPKLPRDAGDRNRTSPFAFTGNKFEFRAVGSTQNVALPGTCLNVAVAESLDALATELEAKLAKGEALEAAVASLLRKTIKAHKRIIFNGNGYSNDWQKEAGKRGLLNLKNTVDALPEIVKPGVIKAFEKFKVLTAAELHARYEINLETYCKTINIEAQLMVLMANRYILPAAFEYMKQVGQSVAAARAGGVPSREGKKVLAQIVKLTDAFHAQTERLAAALEHSSPSSEKHAKYMRDTIVPAMVKLRDLGDQIEVVVPHEVWPLPTYREMLFVK